jgi:hypothetical protein
VILRDWGQLEEAMALLQKQEALCLELIVLTAGQTQSFLSLGRHSG